MVPQYQSVAVSRIPIIDTMTFPVNFLPFMCQTVLKVYQSITEEVLTAIWRSRHNLILLFVSHK
jgi:hypothetical protein